jgi:hypothetical protein
VNTRHTTPSWAASSSAQPGRTRSHGLVALCEATSRTAYLYPNGYALLTQRLVLKPNNRSEQSNDHKYFNTIHEQDVWPTGC